MKDDAERVVKVRLFLEGKVVEFDLPGPLVTMPPRSPKSKKGKGHK